MVALQENKNYNIEDINNNHDNNNNNDSNDNNNSNDDDENNDLCDRIKYFNHNIKYACKYVRRLQVLLIKRSAGQLMILYMP